jgi:hypothetical protein
LARAVMRPTFHCWLELGSRRIRVRVNAAGAEGTGENGALAIGGETLTAD